MTYTIGEVAKMLNISISTLRYYDKEGLLPTVKRTSGNIRMFDEQDIEGLQVMECLKTTGMSLKDIKQFFYWCLKGDDTIKKRYELFEQQRLKTKDKIHELEQALKRIEYKCEFYKAAMERGTTDIPEIKSNLTQAYLSDH